MPTPRPVRVFALLALTGCDRAVYIDNFVTIVDTGSDGCCTPVDCCCDDDETGTTGTTTTTVDETCDDWEPTPPASVEPVGCVTEPAPADIDPRVAWVWPDDFDPSETFKNVITTPVVGHVVDSDDDPEGSPNNEEDSPEVAFVAYNQATSEPGRLVLLNPKSRQEVWKVTSVTDGTDTAYFSANGTAAIGDVDGNGDIEVCAPTLAERYTGGTRRNVVCLNGEDGSLLWMSDNTTGVSMGAIAIADMDRNVVPEVIIGNIVLSGADGTTLAQGSASQPIGGWGYEEPGYYGYHNPISVPIQLDDGNLELVAAGAIYTYEEDTTTGTFSLVRQSVDDGSDDEGFASVADVDLDGEPEIVRTSYTYVSTTQSAGELRVLDKLGGTWRVVAELPFYEHFAGGSGTPSTWYNPTPLGATNPRLRMGAPTIANLDTDPEPEIAVAGAEYYQVFDVILGADGSLDLAHKWQRLVADQTSASTGSSIFDFDADGVAEIVYADQRELYIFDGPTGNDRIVSADFDPASHCSGTATELPTIADVDGDGASEILLASNWPWGDRTPDDWWAWDQDCGEGEEAWQGVRMLQSATDDGFGNGWAPSRPVWNQHAYNISNVGDDSLIPANPANNWDTWNSFREQDMGDRVGAWKPNYAAGEADICDWTCDGDVVTLYYNVYNAGTVDATGLEVELRNAGGTTVDVRTLTAVDSGEGYQAGPVEITKAQWGSGLHMVVDPDNRTEECDEDDNWADLGAWPCD